MIKMMFSCVFMMALTAVFCLQITVKPKAMKCIGQELDNEDQALFKAAWIPNPNNDREEQEMLVTLEDPDGNTLLEKSVFSQYEEKDKYVDLKIDSVSTRGVHNLCFTANPEGNRPVRVEFEIEFQSRAIGASVDPSKKINKSELPALENALLKAEDSIADISREIDYARRQEVLLRSTVESTSDRIQWFGILSIFILLTISLWQMLYLRHFFATKKLL